MSNTTSASAPSPLQAHLFIFVAEVMWGLSAPIAKDIMLQDFNGFQLVSLRIAGSALLFWGLSLLQNQQERVSRSDLAKLMLAGLLSIGFNQTLFTVGLDMTSPVNASIMTTMMPILTMFLAFLILHEPISTLKVLGIVCGATGAILIVLHSSHSGASRADSAEGDLLIIIAQFCFALYLTLFKGVLHRYSGVTCMKWMFTASLLFVVPFTAQSFRTFSCSSEGTTSHCSQHIQLCAASRSLHRECTCRAGSLHVGSRAGCLPHSRRCDLCHTFQEPRTDAC